MAGDEGQAEQSSPKAMAGQVALLDHKRSRFPYCIVWTPIPFLTWLFPIIGHMGICYSTGVIRDFAGPYFVGEDHMAFGKPTKYWRLDPSRVATPGEAAWDSSIYEASEIYKERTHNIFTDNCHSHVATALNLMNYDNSTKWNMVKLAALMLIKSRYVGVGGFLKTWGPFFIILAVIITVYFLSVTIF